MVNRDYFVTLGRLARATPLSLMVDLNLPAQSPQMAQTVGRALRRWLPPASVAGFEIGNEPDLYHAGYVGTMNISPGDGSPFDWALGYSANAYAGDFARYARALRAIWPNVRYAGPEQCSAQTDYVLHALHTGAMSMLTLHRYEFNTRGGLFSPNYPTQAKYLSAADTRGFAAKNRWFVSLARQAGIPVKVTEINDAVGDAPGLTNSFATALWGANTLFDLLAEGMDGVERPSPPEVPQLTGDRVVIRRADRQPALLRDAARDAHPRSRGEPHARRDNRRTSGPVRLGGPRPATGRCARCLSTGAEATWSSGTGSGRREQARSCV